MNVYLLDLDKLPYDFYGELKSISDTNARWFAEKKIDFMVILEKFKIPKVDYMPMGKWTCSYCKNSNTKELHSCHGCGAPINI